jgi:predicted ATPase
MNQQIKLKSIEIKGFKSFSSAGQKIDLGDLTALIGGNGAGKSNFISFFKMINYMMTGSLQNYIGINGGANSILNFGAKNTKWIESEIKFEVDDSNDEYRFAMSYAGSDTLIFTEEELTWHKTGKVIPKKIQMEPGRKESGILDADNQEKLEIKILSKLLRGVQVYQFHDTTNESRIRAKSYINDNNYLRSDGGNLASVLFGLKNSEDGQRYYKRIVDHIKYAIPEFGDFVLEPDILSSNSIILNWKGENSEHLFGPHQLSDGSLRFMALMTLLLRPVKQLPPIIIIDEPELGLHPAAISILASVVKTVQKDRQIILATQSPNLVDEFEAEEIAIIEKAKDDNCTRIKRLDTEALKEWLEEYTLSELWEKNVLGGKP